MFALKVAYVDAGQSEKAAELEERMAGIVGENGGGALGSGGGGKKSELLVTTGAALDTFLNERMSMLESELASSPASSSNAVLTMHERAIRRQILKEFQGACSKCLKCQNCGAFSPKIRHDQFNKMFQVGMPRRNVKVSCEYVLVLCIVD